MHRRTLWTLYLGNLLASVGLWFFLPLLPIFLGRRGGSAALVGVVFAAGLLANAAVRYPAGWAADRFGTRPVMVGSMAVCGLLFLAYLVPLPLGGFVVLRFLHGAAAGAFWPAANALIAEVTPANQRGRAFGVMQTTNVAGMLLGPAIGGFVALFDLNAVFLVSAVASGLATVALVMLPSVRVESSIEAPVGALRIARKLVPLLLLGAGTAYMIGTLDTIWPLYLTFRGASTFAVGLSYMAFAIPAALLSARAGALGDRFGPRRLIVVGLLGTALFAAIYPFVASVGWLIGLGLIEGVFTISGLPSLNAEVSRSAEPGHQARTQGVFQTLQTSTQIVGALAGGALFTVSHTAAFLAITALCLVGVGTALVPRHLQRLLLSSERPRAAATRRTPPPASPGRS
ncbi:MAG TPA: MFS transporter [Candidatus Dormibacteraeota bacterium]|nr:MFS transporter [Candidatus Dormibacteraeota bacterium]